MPFISKGIHRTRFGASADVASAIIGRVTRWVSSPQAVDGDRAPP
jgi:hypothetical protein